MKPGTLRPIGKLNTTNKKLILTACGYYMKGKLIAGHTKFQEGCNICSVILISST